MVIVDGHAEENQKIFDDIVVSLKKCDSHAAVDNFLNLIDKNLIKKLPPEMRKRLTDEQEKQHARIKEDVQPKPAADNKLAEPESETQGHPDSEPGPIQAPNNEPPRAI